MTFPPLARPATRRVLGQTRQNELLTYLRTNKTGHVAELSQVLGASESTIRRDLDELQERGFVERVHGGASITESGIEAALPGASPHATEREAPHRRRPPRPDRGRLHGADQRGYDDRGRAARSSAGSAAHRRDQRRPARGRLRGVPRHPGARARRRAAPRSRCPCSAARSRGAVASSRSTGC